VAINQNTDTLLWNISINDDKSAFRTLFETYYAPLCLYAKRFIEDRAEREDIVQDVFFSIWEKRKQILPSISAHNYLVTCVKNSCLNYLRKVSYFQTYQSKITEKPPLYEENPDKLYALKELQGLLEKALKKLPKEYRLAFTLSYNEKKSIAEIAEIMQVSVRTVERYRHRALEILKVELRDYLPLIIFLLTYGGWGNLRASERAAANHFNDFQLYKGCLAFISHDRYFVEEIGVDREVAVRLK
jgi:RNA polymerase sigma-70 factor (ECF subfamily)